MNLIAHQFRKDVRRLRWVLAIWGALILAQLLLSYSPIESRFERFIPYIGDSLSNMLSWFPPLMLIAIVPILMHEEPHVGMKAFWFTRPIPWRTVLAGKLLFCLLILIIPRLVLEAALWEPVPLDLLASAARWTGVVFILMILAAITPSFERFAFVGINVLVGTVVALLIFHEYIAPGLSYGYIHADLVLSASRPRFAAESSVIVSMVIMAGFGIMALRSQCASRRVSRTVLIAACGVVCVWASPLLHWHFLAQPASVVSPPSARAVPSNPPPVFLPPPTLSTNQTSFPLVYSATFAFPPFIKIQSERVDLASLSSTTHRAITFEGRALVVGSQMTLQCDKLKLSLGPSNEVQRAEATNVQLLDLRNGTVVIGGRAIYTGKDGTIGIFSADGHGVMLHDRNGKTTEYREGIVYDTKTHRMYPPSGDRAGATTETLKGAP